MRCNRSGWLAGVLAATLAWANFAAGQEQEVNTPDPPPTVAARLPAMLRRAIPIEGQFGEGWRQVFALPDTPIASGERLIVWVENGWLCTRHEAADGQFDWQIALCHASDDVLPEVRVTDGFPFVEVSYRDGRYIVRESLNTLRRSASWPLEANYSPRIRFWGPTLSVADMGTSARVG